MKAYRYRGEGVESVSNKTYETTNTHTFDLPSLMHKVNAILHNSSSQIPTHVSEY
jgi:hypothetical protein